MSAEFPAIERALALMRARLRPSDDDEDHHRCPQSRLARLAKLARSGPRRAAAPLRKRQTFAEAAEETGRDLVGLCFRALARHAERRSALRLRLSAAVPRLQRLPALRFSPAMCEQCVRRRGAGRLADLFRACRLKRGAMLALLGAVLAAWREKASARC